MGLGETRTQLSCADGSEVAVEGLSDLFHRYMSSLRAAIAGFFELLPDAICSLISHLRLLFTQQAAALRPLGAAVISSRQIFTASSEAVACMMTVRGLSGSDDVTGRREEEEEGAELTTVPAQVRRARDASVEEAGRSERLERVP